jgi:predicted nucleotide-binding protein (sugar kinase/HSP70/actin superfamily)
MRVGIPRALFYYHYYPLWRAFLETLDVEVVVSPPTSQNILVNYDPHSPVPILHLTFDEHTSDAGLSTRLEAYTDLLRRGRRRGSTPQHAVWPAAAGR